MTRIVIDEWKQMRYFLRLLRQRAIRLHTVETMMSSLRRGIELASRWSCDPDAYAVSRLAWKTQQIAQRHPG